MRASMETLRTEQNTELQTVLTTEQYDRWQKIAAAQFSNRGSGGYQRPEQKGTDDKAPEDKNVKKDKKSKGKKGTPPPPPPTPAPIPEGGNN